MFVRAFRLHGCGLLCLVLLLARADAEPASPSQNASLEMDALAERLAAAIKEEKHDAVAVRAFVDRSTVPSNAGPGLVQLLRESLKKHGIQVRDDAGLEVGGEYFTQVDEKEDRQAVFVRAILRNEKKREMIRVGRKIYGARAAVSLLALTVDDLPPEEEDQDVKIRQAIEEPRTSFDGARILAGPKSLYAIEIVRIRDNDYRHPDPLRPESKNGRAFVALKEKDTYAVRIVNNSPHDAAVTLSIDGLSMFAFKDGEEDCSHILIPAKRTGLIRGWYRSRTKSDAFTITDYARSAAAEALKDRAGNEKPGNKLAVGAITATFAMAWRQSEKPPEDERSRAADIATGRGPNVSQSYQLEARTIGRTRASISVRYVR